MEDFLICPEDLYLVRNFRTFGPIEIQKNVARTSVPFLKNLLGTLACFPTSYSGPQNPEARAGVDLLAGRLRDKYLWNKNRLQRNKVLIQNWYALIAEHARSGKYLIGFDCSWILAGIRDYILEFQEFSADQIDVHRFDDRYLVFAPVNVIQMEHISTWLYQNRQLFDIRSAVAVFNMPLEDILDFQYLHPVQISFLGKDICLIESSVLSQRQLCAAFFEERVLTHIAALDPIKATYAVHVTMENTNFEYPMAWDACHQELVIYHAGYIGTQDLQAEFLRVLTQIELTGVQFTEIPGHLEAVVTATQTGNRCFACANRWYSSGTVPEFSESATRETAEIIRNRLTCLTEKPLDKLSLLELLQVFQDFDGNCHTLRGSDSPDILAKLIFPDRISRAYALSQYALLGYSSKPPGKLSIPNPIGYDTIKAGDSIVTVYYYFSTNGRRIEFQEVWGRNDGEIFALLSELVKQGYFYPQKTRGLVQRYPEFIPSHPALASSLSPNPDLLRDELFTLVKGHK
jgi:hypothetical protein